MHEADAEGAERRSDVMAMVCVAVVAGRESTVTPPKQQPHGEEHDQRCNRSLGSPLDDAREVALSDENRDSERDQRNRMPETPPRSEAGSCAGRPFSSRRQ